MDERLQQKNSKQRTYNGDIRGALVELLKVKEEMAEDRNSMRVLMIRGAILYGFGEEERKIVEEKLK